MDAGLQWWFEAFPEITFSKKSNSGEQDVHMNISDRVIHCTQYKSTVLHA